MCYNVPWRAKVRRIERNMTKEEFLKSKDFMKLGTAINNGSWQVAGMTAQRMQKNAKEAQIDDFDRQLVMIKKCIASRKKNEALNGLAVIVAKRVRMLEREVGNGEESK